MADVVYRWQGGPWTLLDGDFETFKRARHFNSTADDFQRGKGRGFSMADVERITGQSVGGPASENWVHFLIGLKDDGREIRSEPFLDLEFYIRSTKL